MMLLLFKIVFFGVVGVSVLRFPRFGWFFGRFWLVVGLAGFEESAWTRRAP